MKRVRTPNYNYNFDETQGYFERWGRTLQDDPQYSPIGNEILDIEVSTVCHKGCKFCYKSNTAVGQNMSFVTFKHIVDLMPNLMQVAFGIGDIDGNPELFDMMGYCRSIGVVPNLTINGARMTDERAALLAKYCGAVAVSNYNKSECYGAVSQLSGLGMEQVNIHQLMALEAKDQIWELLKDVKTDERLKGLNAIVFLSLKNKGRGTSYTRMPDKDYQGIINYCFENDIRFGMDSCSACRFLKAIKDRENYAKIAQFVEPCESGLFSYYVDVYGLGFPCSFMEGMVESIDLKNATDFYQDVWYHPVMIAWRNRLLKNRRDCPVYQIGE